MDKETQMKFKEPIIFSGGAVKNSGVVKAIEEALHKKVIVHEEPQIIAGICVPGNTNLKGEPITGGGQPSFIEKVFSSSRFLPHQKGSFFS